MKYILWFTMIMMGVLCNAKACNIKKDTDGFVWIINNNSINRYDGKHLRPYLSNLKDASLFSDNRNRIWVATPDGNLYYYDTMSDSYKKDEGMGHTNQIYTFDNNNNFWFGVEDELRLYNPDTRKVFRLKLNSGCVFAVLPITSDKYFVATSSGLYLFSYRNGVMKCLSEELTKGRCMHIKQLCYHTESRKLFINDEIAGIKVYDCKAKRLITVSTHSFSSSVVRLCFFDMESILAITADAVIYHLDVSNYRSDLYADLNLYSSETINLHDIKDVWVDEQKRIWLSDAPIGIIVIDEIPMKCNWTQQESDLHTELQNRRLNRIYCINQQECHLKRDTYIANVSGNSFVWHAISGKFPKKYAPVYWDELIIHNRSVKPGEDGSPLKQSIRYTKVLNLSYSENSFTIKAVSPAYDSPSDLVYTWKLGDGEWSRPSAEGSVVCNNLRAGKHQLSIRTFSTETGELIAQRNILIMVRSPFWKTGGAYAMYSLLSVLLGLGILKRTSPKVIDSFTLHLLMDKKENSVEDKYQPPMNPHDVAFMKRVDEEIEKCLIADKIRLSTIFRAVGMSRTGFFLKVKALTGLSPKEYITKYRIAKAAGFLLTEENLRISEAANSVGFTDTKYFRLVFKKYYNMSPSAYKKQHGK